MGEHDGSPFLVMEFIEGQTLDEVVKKFGRPSLDRVCEIGQQIAEALAFAHHNGVIHRDIKPANILMTSRETYGIERPKITDFGVAKLVAGQTTLSGQMLGTPAFMPPEQFTGSEVDGRADIFSLGVILYWMATGEQAFPGETITAVSYKIVHTEALPPSKLNPSVSSQLEAVILKCLAKSPADRYQTGRDLAQDLGAVRAGGTVNRTVQQPAAFDTDATLVGVRASTVALPPSQSSSVQAKPSAASNPNSKYAMAAVAAVLFLAAGGWFLLRGRQQAPAEQAAIQPVAAAPAPAPLPSEVDAAPQPSEPANAVPAAPTSAAPVTPASGPAKSAPAPAAAKPAPRNAVGQPKVETVSAAKPAASAAPAAVPPVAPPSPAASAPAAAPAAPPAVDFDRKALDPKENARLNIDATHMPADLDFMIEMNGKVYFHRAMEGNKPKYEDLLVPPGIQEFRILAKNGADQKVSNIVSTEFQAKKRKTLRVELRLVGQSADSGTPQALYPNTQLVATLK